jgi:hypothetical protein
MNDFYDIGSKTQIKRKFKDYLNSINNVGLKQNKFSLYLSNILVILLDDMVLESISYIEKDNITGIYLVKLDYIKFILLNNSKYDFINKYVKSYSSTIRYQENLYFNIEKVYKNLDEKYGKKMMLDNQVKNFLNYILVSIQYDITNFSCVLLNFSSKKTFSKDLLIESIKYIIHNDYIFNRMILKLDSYNEIKSDDKEDNEEKEDETDV